MKKTRKKRYEPKFINSIFEKVLKLVKEGHSNRSACMLLELTTSFSNNFNIQQKDQIKEAYTANYEIRINRVGVPKGTHNKAFEMAFKEKKERNKSPFKKIEHSTLYERNYILDMPIFKYSKIV